MKQCSKIHLSGALLGSLILSGCAMGPDYSQPQLAKPTALVSQPEAASTVDITRWWEAFGDPTLNRLIDEAVAQNNDIRVALARVQQSRAAVRSSRSQRMPNVNAGGSATRQRVSENSPNSEPILAFGGEDALVQNLYTLSTDLSWELDLFGRTERLVEAAKANTEAAENARRGVVLTVLSEVADAYFGLRGFQQQIIVQETTIRLQEETLDFVKVRLETGLESELAVLQAQGQLEASRSVLPLLEAGARINTYRLATLLGRSPEEALRIEAAAGELLETQAGLFPAAVPADILRRRPDVAAAERELAAATALEAAAVADFFPRLQLTGGIGLQSSETGSTLDGASRFWQFGPGLQLPIFQGGRLRAQLDSAEAATDLALAQYEQSVLRALEEAESAYTQAYQSHRSRELLEAAADATQRAAERARSLYEEGLANFLTVLDAEQRQAEVDLRLAERRTSAAQQLVQLYRALGGGWERFEARFAQNAE